MVTRFPSESGEFPALERPREAYRYTEALDADLIRERHGRIEFVRHVITPYKLEGRVGRLQGTLDVLLPDEALEEAVRTAAAYVDALPDGLHGIYSPELVRAYYTAAVFSGTLERADRVALPLEVLPELNEFDFGDWQGRLIAEELHPDPDHLYWQAKPLSASLEGRLPNTEGFLAFLQRVNFAFEHVARALPAESEQKSLIVTCGMAWRAIRYLEYLASQGVERLTAEQVLPHEYRFFNSEQGRFFTLHHAGGQRR